MISQQLPAHSARAFTVQAASRGEMKAPQAGPGQGQGRAGPGQGQGQGVVTAKKATDVFGSHDYPLVN